MSTSNIPILRSIIEIPTGGVSASPCKVFFINKVHQMDMKWGTQSAIPLEDPLYDIFMHVMLHGSMSVSVDDSRKFMLKMVGFQKSFYAESQTEEEDRQQQILCRKIQRNYFITRERLYFKTLR